MIQMASVFGEQERQIIRSRVLAGLDRVRQQGKKLGRPKVSPKIEDAIRRHLSAGNGILKVAANGRRRKRHRAASEEGDGRELRGYSVATATAAFATQVYFVDGSLSRATPPGASGHAYRSHVRPTTSILPSALTPNRSTTRRERVFSGKIARSRKTAAERRAHSLDTPHRFGCKTLTPDGGVERVAQFTLECQRDVSGRLGVPNHPLRIRCSGAANSTTRSIKPQRPISAPSSLRSTAR